MTITITRIHVGLLAALGVAVIASVGWAAIPSANGTISACKDNKGALKVIDAEAGQACPGSQQLLQWSRLGAGGVSGLTIVTRVSTSDSSTFRLATVECPAGKKVVGGGGDIGEQAGNSVNSPAGVAISTSAPYADNGWGVVAQEIVPHAGDWTVVVRAMCADAA